MVSVFNVPDFNHTGYSIASACCWDHVLWAGDVGMTEQPLVKIEPSMDFPIDHSCVATLDFKVQLNPDLQLTASFPQVDIILLDSQAAQQAFLGTYGTEFWDRVFYPAFMRKTDSRIARLPRDAWGLRKATSLASPAKYISEFEKGITPSRFVMDICEKFYREHFREGSEEFKAGLALHEFRKVFETEEHDGF